MLDTVVITRRDRIDSLRLSIAHSYRLHEVVRVRAESEWSPVSGREPFDWGAPLPQIGAKQFFFPQRETLLRWRGEDAVHELLPDPPPLALFGVRACDLTAIGYQDQFFATDPWYVRRREHALLVGINCTRACSGGFCRDVDAGPFVASGCDLNLTPLADGRVVVEVGTGLGRQVLGDSGVLIETLDAESQSAFDAAREAAIASFPSRPFVTAGIAAVDRLIRGSDGEQGTIGDAGPGWKAFGPACFACTGCSNVCPTCSCFTVVDEPAADGGERVRCWDSCLLEGFQREASGHHPAPTPAERVRRFWYHKLSADFVDEFGRLGCVGCGRCDTVCPGSIGALAVLRRLAGEHVPRGA